MLSVIVDQVTKPLCLSVVITFLTCLPAAAQDQLSPPDRPVIQLLEEIPSIQQNARKPEPTQASGGTAPKVAINLDLTTQLTLPRDAQPSPPPLPDVGKFYDMPGTNGKVEYTRITNAADDNSRRHHYSRRSAIDPFNKYILFHDYLYNLANFSEFKKVPLGYEYVASQQREDEFFGFHGKNVFSKWNAKTDEVTPIFTAPTGKGVYTLGQYEGELSWDDKIAALTWDQNGGSQITVVNTETGQVLGALHSSAVDEYKLNWVDVSASGKYILVGTQRGVYRYNNDMTNKVKLNSKSPGSAHGDLMYDVAGNEVFVQEGNFNHGKISYTTLESNENFTTSLVDTNSQSGVEYPNTASHISGQARDVQGYVLISLQDTSGMFNMFGAYLVPGQTELYKYGFSFTHGNRYASEAKATINNAGTAIVWSSDWMGGSVYEYFARIK